MDKHTKDDTSKIEILEAISRGFSLVEERMDSMEEKMATKEELKNELIKVYSILETMATKESLDQIKVELRDFKSETRERFDSVDERLNEIDENIDGVVQDYHPHMVALEEKVFGVSTLAEA